MHLLTYLYGAETFVEITVTQMVKNSSSMELGESLPRSQQPATKPYTEQDESSPHLHTLVL
jgi:hypothetical protein